MNPATKKILSGVIAGATAGVTSTMAVLAETSLPEVSSTQWALIGLGVTGVMLKDWKTFLAQPPSK